MHKANRFLEGSTVVIEQRQSDLSPLTLFDDYLTSRDQLFPHLPELWQIQRPRSHLFLDHCTLEIEFSR